MKNIRWLMVLIFCPVIFGGCFIDKESSDNSKNLFLLLRNIPVTGVSINKTSTTIDTGDSEQLTATVEPSNANNKTIIWSTSSPGKAVVSSTGLITAVGAAGGAATITAKTDDGSFTQDCLVTINAAPAYSADGVSFKMAYVPGIIFPVKTADSETATVNKAYWIGETEVTYELWGVVYTWAVANGYTFTNAGAGNSNAHPVTNISWRDCLVFCNAITEWYNAKIGTGYTCVYMKDGSPLRISNGDIESDCEGVVPIASSTGFRMLLQNEWELAARWRNDITNTVADYTNPYFTKGNSASGATKNYLVGDTDTIAFAIYSANSGSSSAVVKSRAANALDLYDMSGNVAETCFDDTFISGEIVQLVNLVVRGGSWSNSAEYMQVGNLHVIGNWNPAVAYGTHVHTLQYDTVGFRLARNGQ